MVRLKWDNEDSPMYQAGVSQGVFYGDDGVGHAWSGLISVTEKPQNNAPTAVYNAMGEKYDIFGNIAEKKHGLACYVYPEVMDEYLGYEYSEEFGFVVDERPPKKFHMAYRVELGEDLYEIHVLLNQIATFGETARQTITSNIAPSTITMNLEGAVDPRLGTSHIVLDSRNPLTESAEILLFGDRYTNANMNYFLEADPLWETVAANYAPIIEPDYDNLVWLGGSDYRPGIKNSSNWISNNGLIKYFYDENSNGLGLYSTTTFDSLNTYSDLYWDDINPYLSINTIPGSILDGRSVYATAKVTMVDPISDLISSRYATIGVGQHGPTADSPPNTRGESVLYVLNDDLQVPVGSEYDALRLYHGGASDTAIVIFTDILISPIDQEPTFFDVNSKPPTMGIRYQRVSTPNGHYSIKQVLSFPTSVNLFDDSTWENSTMGITGMIIPHDKHRLSPHIKISPSMTYSSTSVGLHRILWFNSSGDAIAGTDTAWQTRDTHVIWTPPSGAVTARIVVSPDQLAGASTIFNRGAVLFDPSLMPSK